MKENVCWDVGEIAQDSDVVTNIPTSTRNWKLKDVARVNGEWNYDMIANILPVMGMIFRFVPVTELVNLLSTARIAVLQAGQRLVTVRSVTIG
jgi:hypothetical protein